MTDKFNYFIPYLTEQLRRQEEEYKNSVLKEKINELQQIPFFCKGLYMISLILNLILIGVIACVKYHI